MGFGALKDLAKQGFLPRKIAKAEDVICAACHIGKGIKKAAEKGTSIISDKIEKPGDLFHTDQAESTTPGRPMTASGKNNKNKIYYVTLFVDSISKKLFVEFQQSTDAKATIKSKHAVEKDAQTSGVAVKAFRSDNGVFRAAEFRADLLKNDQEIT